MIGFNYVKFYHYEKNLKDKKITVAIKNIFESSLFLFFEVKEYIVLSSVTTDRNFLFFSSLKLCHTHKTKIDETTLLQLDMMGCVMFNS